ncbi:MAG: primosomal replication protein N [Burkholderiaceae bacterium]|nr:primosomal replication protein N [Burkholderiaceae bacterium]
MRYTPAGLPALDFQLEHESEVEEAGQTRQVSVVIRAVTFGSQAESLGRQTIGSLWRFSGFLAAARGGKGVVLHVQQFQSADRPGDPT